MEVIENFHNNRQEDILSFLEHPGTSPNSSYSPNKSKNSAAWVFITEIHCWDSK